MNDLRQPEVEHLRDLLVSDALDHDVSWLQVAMNDTERVCLDQRIENLGDDPHRAHDSDPPALRDPAERLSAQIFGDEKGSSIFHPTVVDQLERIRVPELS